MLQNSAYTCTHTGRIAKDVVTSGSYSVAAGRITLRQLQGACSAKSASNGCRFMGCPGPGTGTYRFAKYGDKLTFTSVADSCKSRRVVLAGSFHKVR